MLTFDKFSGINNVLPSHRLDSSALTAAENLDIGLSGELRRRSGYSVLVDTCHKNLWQADGFMLATVDGGDLVGISSLGARTPLLPSLGVARVWYCNLPDGRVMFSNGLINGITDGTAVTGVGVPVPEHVGAATPITGGLFAGSYRYQLTRVRLSDGLEGGAAFSDPVEVTDGGLLLTGLPELSGYKLNVYLTSANGETAFLAGSTTGSTFSYIGKNDALAQPAMTGHLTPLPVGTIAAFWRGRVLAACGGLLCASLPHQWELHDPRRDFKRMSAPITAILPVDDGVYVGTTEDLVFLGGTAFDQLAHTPTRRGPVVLGSGVAAPGNRLRLGDGAGAGEAALCIAGGEIVAGFNGGQTTSLTAGRYRTVASEVCAVFREIDGVPQYVAVPQ